MPPDLIRPPKHESVVSSTGDLSTCAAAASLEWWADHSQRTTHLFQCTLPACTSAAPSTAAAAATAAAATSTATTSTAAAG